MRSLPFFALGLLAGALLAVQSVLNASLGKRTGQVGSMLILAVLGTLTILLLSAFFPNSVNFKRLPGAGEWYLYVGAFLGAAILGAPIFLIPRIGTAATLTALVVGQLVLSLVIDHFGLFSSPRIELSLIRVLGLVMLVAGAVLILKK